VHRTGDKRGCQLASPEESRRGKAFDHACALTSPSLSRPCLSRRLALLSLSRFRDCCARAAPSRQRRSSAQSIELLTLNFKVAFSTSREQHSKNRAPVSGNPSLISL